MKKQSGFTLIELMIVVAIVAILAAIAMPAYQSYTGKAKFTEVMTVASGLENKVEMCRLDLQTLKGCDSGQGTGKSWAIPAATDFATDKVKSITVKGADDGQSVTITGVGAGAGIDGVTIVYNGTLNAAGVLKWAMDTDKTKSTCIASDFC